MQAYTLFCDKYSLDRNASSTAQVFSEHFIGAYNSKLEWAKEYLRDVEFLSHELHQYFNFETYVRDCELNKIVEFIMVGDRVFVFLPFSKYSV